MGHAVDLSSVVMYLFPEFSAAFNEFSAAFNVFNVAYASLELLVLIRPNMDCQPIAPGFSANVTPCITSGSLLHFIS